MCRFALYLGPEITLGSLVTEPANSIIHQSFDSRERRVPLNGDGFGVAWYVPGFDEPAIFKDVTPAWSNINLVDLARVTRTGCLLAHVRAATPGNPVQQLNCHPFRWGRYAFMHNGIIGNFHSIRRQLLRRLTDEAYEFIQGTTDSEYIFALFADHLLRSERSIDPLTDMARALRATIRTLNEMVREFGVEDALILNLAIADGERAVVSRYSTNEDGDNSLYYTEGGRYLCADGHCTMAPAANGEHAVIVASEPLSADPVWHEVGQNSMVLIDSDRSLTIEEISIGL